MSAWYRTSTRTANTKSIISAKISIYTFRTSPDITSWINMCRVRQMNYINISHCCFTKAIEIDPNYADAYYNRGIVYGKQGNLTQSASDFAKALIINPNYAGTYYNSGIVYAKQGNFTQAISDYSKAIEINPNFGNAYFNRGLAYAKQSDFAQAFSIYTLNLTP